MPGRRIAARSAGGQLTPRLYAPRPGVASLSAGSSFPRTKRLTAAAEFGRVFAEPLRSSDRFFTVLARPNTVQTARLGLTISRRAAKRAVDRNRLKRLARECFRHRPELPPCDFVVLAKPPAARADAADLRASLEEHFTRLERKTRAAGAPRG